VILYKAGVYYSLVLSCRRYLEEADLIPSVFKAYFVTIQWDCTYISV